MPPSMQSSPSSGLIYGLTAMGEGHGFKAELWIRLEERGVIPDHRVLLGGAGSAGLSPPSPI